jgi:hypothetical protein
VRLLIIGGTLFLGRRLVESALARGHHVTTFTRGRHNPGIHTDVEVLRGDRNSDVSALNGRLWDAVVDTCGYVPVGVTRVIRRDWPRTTRSLHVHLERIGLCRASADRRRRTRAARDVDRGSVEGSGRDGDRRACNGPHVW